MSSSALEREATSAVWYAMMPAISVLGREIQRCSTREESCSAVEREQASQRCGARHEISRALLSAREEAAAL